MKNMFIEVRLLTRILAILFLFSIATSSQVLAQDAAAQRIKELEQQLQVMQSNMQTMQNGMQAMQQELEKFKSQSTEVTQKIQQVENIQKKERTVASTATNNETSKNNMVFFRGGFAHNVRNHNGLSYKSNVAPVGAQDLPDRDAWYFGAGFDFNLTNDAWGLAPKTSVLAELMFEYKQFSSHVQGNVLANEPTQLAGGTLNPRRVTVSQLSVYASPKIKFREGSRFRPWIIPAGFGVHIISPPGESASFFIPGVVFGGGAEYRIWKDIYAGVDARYHITGGKKDSVNVDGLTAGGYLGIGF